MYIENPDTGEVVVNTETRGYRGAYENDAKHFRTGMVKAYDGSGEVWLLDTVGSRLRVFLKLPLVALRGDKELARYYHEHAWLYVAVILTALTVLACFVGFAIWR
jgi:hypothetical protein